MQPSPQAINLPPAPVEVRAVPQPLVTQHFATLASKATPLPLPVPSPPTPLPTPYKPPVQPTTASMAITDGLVGSLGYSLPYGNCVNEPGVNNPGYGNPISWPVLYYQPHVGSTVLFVFNHTAVVSGLWGNGDIEVRQQNAPGMPHRISPSMVRGYR